MRVRIARFLAIMVTVLAVAGITFVWASTSAGASNAKSTSTISVGNQVKLASSIYGPGANVTVSYSCFPGFGGGKGGYGGDFGSVTLTDLPGNKGFGSFNPTCDDRKHTAVVFVFGFFNSGGGAVQSYICGFDCAFTTQEVRIS
jgi:hypothetical protein